MVIDPDDLLDAVERDDNSGFCINCGEEVYGVEPDARNYPCEHCDGKRTVFGAQELLIMWCP